MCKKEQGITIVALVITIIIMLILVGVSIEIGSNIIDKSNLEDIKTNMLAIQGKSMSIGEKNSFDPGTNPLVGVQITDKINYIVSGYTISADLKSELEKVDSAEGGAAEYFIWTKQNLIDSGLNNIKTDDSKVFYIVDYNSNEVFYSIGYQGVYDLTTLKTK